MHTDPQKRELATMVKQDRNVIAALLSILPGLGHIYKHHYAYGFALMLVGTPVVLWIATLMTLATLGLSIIIVPLAYWAFVIYDAYQIADWHRRGAHHHSLLGVKPGDKTKPE